MKFFFDCKHGVLYYFTQSAAQKFLSNFSAGTNFVYYVPIGAKIVIVVESAQESSDVVWYEVGGICRFRNVLFVLKKQWIHYLIAINFCSPSFVILLVYDFRRRL